VNIFQYMKIAKWFIVGLVAYSLNSCYSFKTAGIPPGLQTFYVEEFDNTALNVVPTLAIDFTQKLITKARIEGKLSYTEFEPHVDFKGVITNYSVTSQAPEEGQTTAFNRLEIIVKVTYTNNLEEDSEKSWEDKTFSFFEDYPSDVNLLDVQDDLIENISDQIIEDIFNAAFSGW